MRGDRHHTLVGAGLRRPVTGQFRAGSRPAYLHLLHFARHAPAAGSTVSSPCSIHSQPGVCTLATSSSKPPGAAASSKDTATPAVMPSSQPDAPARDAIQWEMWPGKSYPLGATYDGSGGNFA